MVTHDHRGDSGTRQTGTRLVDHQRNRRAVAQRDTFLSDIKTVMSVGDSQLRVTALCDLTVIQARLPSSECLCRRALN